MSLYTLTIADSKNLLSDDIKTAIKKDVDYVIANCIDRYVDWKGTLDFKVNIKTNAEFFNEVDWAKNLSNSDGCLPGAEMAWVGSRKSNLIEATTGIDLNGSESDAGFTIYLGVDGTVKLFGVPLWLDPNPVFNTTPAIPTGYYDFISVALHEIIHTLAFDGVSDSASPFGALSTVSGDHYNFTGDHVTALLGGSLPMTADNHVVSSLCTPYAESGLMRDWGNYDQNRWDIGRIELAVMQDLGYDISADLTGLSYTDIDDRNPAIVGTTVADTLYGDFQGNKITGDAGNDNIDGGLDTDAAVYLAARANYTVDKTDSGLTVIDTTGTEGTDSLIAIERLQFTDVSLAFDTDAANNAGGIYRLYKAALNRTPRFSGLRLLDRTSRCRQQRRRTNGNRLHLCRRIQNALWRADRRQLHDGRRYHGLGHDHLRKCAEQSTGRRRSRLLRGSNHDAYQNRRPRAGRDFRQRRKLRPSCRAHCHWYSVHPLEYVNLRSLRIDGVVTDNARAG